MKPGTDAWVVALELAGHPRAARWVWRPGVRAGLVPGGGGEPLWWRLVLWQDALGGAPEAGARGAVAVWTAWVARTSPHAPPIVDLYDAATAGVVLDVFAELLGHWPGAADWPPGPGVEPIGVEAARRVLALWGAS